MSICNYCASPDNQIIYTFEHSQIVRCNKCDLIYTADTSSKEDISAYYEQKYYSADYKLSYFEFHFSSRLLPLYRFYERIILTYEIKSKKLLLDIGSGMGHFIHYMSLNGWRTMGIEPSIAYSHYGREILGEDLKQGDFLTIPITEQFSVVTLFHTLEHVDDLRTFIDKIHSLLLPSGILLIEVPNIESPFARIQQNLWGAIDPFAHRYYFTETTLSRYLKDAGFTILTIQKKQSERNLLLLTLFFSLLSILGFKPSTHDAIASQNILLRKESSQKSTMKSKLFTQLYIGVVYADRLLFPLRWLITKLGWGEELFVVARKNI
jgi:2-polyprenyl-3-methyl-5-hydroxy-6-metoxy-1,4-benzoquinol methylase